jgi:hypothetical protein
MVGEWAVWAVWLWWMMEQARIVWALFAAELALRRSWAMEVERRAGRRLPAARMGCACLIVICRQLTHFTTARAPFLLHVRSCEDLRVP